MSSASEYSGFELCESLTHTDICIRILRYEGASRIETFHEHMPSRRLSDDNACQFLRTTLIRYSKLGDFEILKCFINRRSKNPSKIDFIQVNLEYPEPGVLRKYFTSRNYTAWFDKVISKEKFRGKE